MLLEGYSADYHAVRGSSSIICRMMQPGSESLTLDFRRVPQHIYLVTLVKWCMRGDEELA